MEQFDEIEEIGVGAYGKVYRARRRRKGDLVAVKKVRTMDGVTNDFHPTTLREISIVSELQHENIIKLLQIIPQPKKVLMIFEHLDCDLKTLIGTRPQEITPSFIKRTMFQLLKAVDFIHSKRVIHRDLKSQNVLIDQSRTVAKIADFGLARTFTIPARAYTHEVVTLWYRAPEILLGMAKYATAIDIWSLGCIFIELANQRHPFCGESEIDQLLKIFEIMGTPNEETLPGLDMLNVQIRSCQQWSAKSLQKVVELPDPLAVDLISKMLCYDPRKRITATDALLHPYFNSMRNPIEPRALQPTTLINRCSENIPRC